MLKISCNFTGLEVKVNYIEHAVWGVRKLLTTKVVSCEYKLRPWRTSCLVSLSFLRGKKMTEMTKNQSKCVEAVQLVPVAEWPPQLGAASGLQHINLYRIFYTGFPDLSGCTVPPGQVTPQPDRRPDKRCGSEAESKQNDLACLMVFTQQLDNRSSRTYQLKPSAGPLSPVCHWFSHLLHGRWFNWIISAKWALNQCNGFKFFI